MTGRPGTAVNVIALARLVRIRYRRWALAAHAAGQQAEAQAYWRIANNIDTAVEHLQENRDE